MRHVKNWFSSYGAVLALRDVRLLFSGLIVSATGSWAYNVALLALVYQRLFERDPKDFQVRYVALLENGFDDAPAALLRRFLGIDLNDGTALVRDATALIDGRTTTLEGLYADCGETAASAATCPGR